MKNERVGHFPAINQSSEIGRSESQRLAVPDRQEHSSLIADPMFPQTYAVQSQLAPWALSHTDRRSC